MTTRRLSLRIPGAVARVIAALVAAALAVLIAVSVAAAEGDFRPVLQPVDYDGSYFNLEFEPGQTRELTVEVGNEGSALTAVRTYAADAYTIINGGFGVRLHGEPRSSATLWLDYADETVELPAGRSVERTFRVSVPTTAGPGEYITSIVVENRDPILGTGEISINQVLRQAMAVVVTVPGPKEPGLAIGTATHVLAADRSFVRIGLQNTGNVRLQPAAEIRITDSAGREVAEAPIAMDSFYAFTDTFLELALAMRLAPGTYLVDVVVIDEATGVRAGANDLPLIVEAPAPAAGSALPPIVGEIIDAIDGGVPLVPLAVIAVLLAAAIAVVLTVRTVGRRRR